MGLAEKLKSKYQEKLAGELESFVYEGETIYWKPLTGIQQKQIQSYADKSISEGICGHVKVRALDSKGEHIFKDVTVLSMLHDYELQPFVEIFNAMSGAELTTDDIEKN